MGVNGGDRKLTARIAMDDQTTRDDSEEDETWAKRVENRENGILDTLMGERKNYG